jgi:hypothetical protein
MEPFRIALQDYLWSEDEADPLPTLVGSYIGADKRTVCLVVKTGHITHVTYRLPIPLDYPEPQRQIFGLGPDDQGISNPVFTEGGTLPGRPWLEAIEEEEDEVLRDFWVHSLHSIRLMFPTVEEYLNNLTDYLRNVFKSDPSHNPATFVTIYTQRSDKRRIAIFIKEEAMHRIDYYMPVPEEYPIRLFPGKEKGAILGADGPTHVTVDWRTEQAVLDSTGFLPWEDEVERLEQVPNDGSVRYRLIQNLLTYWEDMMYNIFVVLKKAGIIARSRIEHVRSGSDPRKVIRSQRLKKGARSENLRRPARRTRTSQRSERKTKRRSNIHVRFRDPNDPAAVSSEIGRVVPPRRRTVSSRAPPQPISEYRTKSEPKGPIL